MAVFIELTTDPFKNRLGEVANSEGKTKGAGLPSVRRPLRGIEIKEDTYAYIKLVPLFGDAVEILDSSSQTGKSSAYSNFILQSVSDQRMERHQLIETFGDTYCFFFGEAPRMLQVNSVVINTHDFNWKDEFMANYERYMSGTRSLELGCRSYLFYDSNIVEGYMVNASIQMSSDQPYMAQLSFQLFVCNAQSISLLGDPNFPIRESVMMPEGMSLVETMNGEQMELMFDNTVEGAKYWMNTFGRIGGTNRLERPLREKTFANRDEYTTPFVSQADVEAAQLDRWQEECMNRNQEEVEKTFLEKIGDYAKKVDQWGQDFTKGVNDWTKDSTGGVADWLGMKPNKDGSGYHYGKDPTDPNQQGGFVNPNKPPGDSGGFGLHLGGSASASVGPDGIQTESSAEAGVTVDGKEYSAGAGAGWGWKPGEGSTSHSETWAKETEKAGGYGSANSGLFSSHTYAGTGNSNSSGSSVPVNGSPSPFLSVSFNGKKVA